MTCKTRNCKRETWSPRGDYCLKHEKQRRAKAAAAETAETAESSEGE